MKEKIAKIVTVLGILFLLYVTFMPLIALEMWHVQQGGKPFYERAVDSIKEGFDKTINRGKYNKYLDEYIKERFGNAVVEKLKIVNNDSYRYTIKFDSIMDSKFTVYTNTKTGKCGDTLNAVISTDKKFLHLYSEWVKKQVGIEDENVELVIGFKPEELDFKSITKLSDDCSEIFESVKKSGFSAIYVKNIKDLNKNNYKEYFHNVRELYSLNGRIDNNNFYMDLTNYDCDFFNKNESPIKPLVDDKNNLFISVFFWNGEIENVKINGSN